MRILGIDPGTAICGWGIVDRQGSHTQSLGFGVIRTVAQWAPERRLAYIHDALSEILKTHQPQFAAVEKLFFGQNSTTALAVGQARGVILLGIAQAGIPLVEMTPNEIKQTVTGYGLATKAQIQGMVQRLLGLKTKPTPDDAADALAIALTGLEYVRFKGVIHDR